MMIRRAVLSLAAGRAEARISTPQEFTAFRADEMQRWGELVRAANIRAE
jgi:tripartite-type tricarboxylate transporter receptor subunit TctC